MSEGVRIDAATVRVDAAAAPLRGSVTVPGSKSLSTRALVLAAISPAPVLLRGLLASEDTRHLAEAIGTMGGRVSRLLGDDWRVDGRELAADARSVAIDLGDGGAPTRFAMALALLRAGDTSIDGSPRMRERPIEDGVRLLRALGATVAHAETPGRLPILVRGGAARRLDRSAVLDVARTASSQFVSALMLVAPALPAGLRLRFMEAPTSASYLELTIESLRAFGAAVRGEARRAGDEVEIEPGLKAPAEAPIAADASSVVVWVAAAAMIPGSRIELPGVRRDRQPDRAAIEAIGAMGARLRWDEDRLVVEHAALRGIDIDAGDWPDGSLAVAAAATAAQGTTRLRSLGTLRVKESDRLDAMSDGLTRFGIGARVDGDDLVVSPSPARPSTARSESSPRAEASPPSAALAPRMELDPRRDHRLAMSFALLALARNGAVIRDPACVAKSYPAFWRHLAALAGRSAVAV